MRATHPRRSIGLSLWLAVTAACTSGEITGDLTPDTAEDDSPRFVRADSPIAGRYIVVLEADSLRSLVVGDRTRDLGRDYALRAVAPFASALTGFVAEMDEEDALALSTDPRVRFVEEDGVVQASVTQSSAPWGLDRIDQTALPLDGTYTYQTAAANVHAYIIDTGIRASHNDFGGRVSGGTTAVNDGRGTDDCNGHGTHVAGTVGGATFGVAKGVLLHPVRVLGCQGQGSTSGVIAGVDWVTANAQRPAVANMSLGGGNSPALDQAVRNSIAAGIPYAVAAGNANANACGSSPASTAEALTVAATGRTDARASFSNHGTCVDLFAPGEGIASTYHQTNTSTAVLSGTSMASPHVAGAVALYLAGNPDASPAQVAQALLGGANQNRVTDPKGSPNRLLDARFAAAGTPPPPGDPTDPDPDPAPDPDPDPTPAPDPDGTPHSGTAQGTLARGQRVDFVPLAVLPGTTVQVQMTGAGDADLYVRFNQRPQLVDRPTQTAYLCVPFRDGSNEVCQMQVPPDAATVNIMVHGFTAASYRLQAQWTSP